MVAGATTVARLLTGSPGRRLADHVPLAAGHRAALLSPARSRSSPATFEEGRIAASRSAVWGAVFGSSTAAGVLLGGALTAPCSWSSIFFVNVPFGLLVFRATHRGPERTMPTSSAATSTSPAQHRSRRPGAARVCDDARARRGWGSAERSLADRLGGADPRVRRRHCAPAPLLPMRLFQLRTLPARISPGCCWAARSSRSSSC